MKIFALKRADGGVSLLYTAKGSDPLVEIHKWEALHGEKVSFEEITEADIPENRDFRDAWEFRGNRVRVDMQKARELQLGVIRKKRDAKLVELDVEFTKALGKKNGAQQDKIEADRQKLRDLPVTIRAELDVALTPEDLKKVTGGL